jgi:SET domain-containing protein
MARYEKFEAFKKLGVSQIANKGLGLVALEDIHAGERVLKLGGRLLKRRPARDPRSMRIGEKLYLTSSGFFDDYLNHSCEPNCAIDFSSLTLFAIKHIKKGEEITVNYCTIEYQIAPSYRFRCACGSKSCVGVVSGFKNLPKNKKEELLRFVAPYIKMRVQL